LLSGLISSGARRDEHRYTPMRCQRLKPETCRAKDRGSTFKPYDSEKPSCHTASLGHRAGLTEWAIMAIPLAKIPVYRELGIIFLNAASVAQDFFS
jgi:hypothetical protein